MWSASPLPVLLLGVLGAVFVCMCCVSLCCAREREA